MGDSHDDDSLNPSGGDPPGTDLDVTSNPAENPVWERNRPGRWGRSRDLFYYGSIAGAWLICLVGVAIPPLLGLDRRPPLPVSTLYALALIVAVVQCYLGFALMQTFDFIGGRANKLEELSLTELSGAEIARGSYAAGIRGSNWTLLPILILELWLSVSISDYWEEAFALTLFVILPFHLLLQMQVISHFLRSRLSFRRLEPSLLMWLPMKCGGLAAFQCGLVLAFSGFVAATIGLPILGLSGIPPEVAFATAFAMLHIATVVLFARRTIRSGWSVLSIHVQEIIDGGFKS